MNGLEQEIPYLSYLQFYEALKSNDLKKLNSLLDAHEKNDEVNTVPQENGLSFNNNSLETNPPNEG